MGRQAKLLNHTSDANITLELCRTVAKFTYLNPEILMHMGRIRGHDALETTLAGQTTLLWSEA